MNERKSLSEALESANLPQEALLVIQGGVGRTTPEPEKLVKPKSPAVAKGNKSREPAEPVANMPTPTRGLVSLSVRVQSKLADHLLKVAFGRKLQRTAPFTQQDIVTEAVLQWLDRNGYAFGEE
ncbi:MAG TPA: hypothetical protein PLX89_00845 [Verrucomicrobiota bacterium]|nr:hypothetical protein [Verrucomicrobiales bacterium]HRI11523.1 hypothetical protein [Verrucomicrobiota bacterium]